MPTILDLNNTKASEWFLHSENYCNIELPHYFCFQELLDKVSDYLNNKELLGLINEIKPEDLDDVNYSILNNKDGALSWRPFKIIHPVFYVQIVKTITESNNWDYIIKRFIDFKKK